MKDPDIPWLLPGRVKGEAGIKPGSTRDRAFHQALTELANSLSIRWSKTVSPETILRTLALRRNDVGELADARQWLKDRTKQLKQEYRNASTINRTKTKQG